MNIQDTAGKNVLTGTDSDDILSGLDGNDLIKASLGDDILYGDDDYASTEGGNDTLYGESGDDQLYGGAGADKIFGGSGRDYIGLKTDKNYNGSYKDGNGDVIDGGSGRDTLGIDYSTYAAALTLKIGEETSAQTLTGGIKVINVEKFEIIGTAFADTITGGNYADLLHGGDGKDTLRGGNGNDELFGGSGDDRLYGGNGKDALWGDGDNDTLYGDNGDDLLRGGDGTDTLSGGNQNDRLYGDNGNDVLYGGKGNDILRGGIDVVDLSDNHDLKGSDKNRDGTYGANKLYGGDGNDLLYHDGGNDLLEGGAGNDEYRHWMGYGKATIIDSSGKDRLVLEDFTGNFTAKSADVTTTLSDGTTFKGIENFTIHAKGDADRKYTFGAGADVLWAGDGNDTIKGGDGNDTLNAGGGKDNVDAGAGNDTVELGYGKGDQSDGGSGTDKVTVHRASLDAKGLTFSVSGTTANLSDGTVLKNFERYSVYFGSGNDVVKSVGAALSVEFDGGDGDDTLLGGDGNDILEGGGGSDTIKAGAGNDTITDHWNYTNSKNTIDAGSGNDTVSVTENSSSAVDFTVNLGSGNDEFRRSGYTKGTLSIDGGKGTDLVSLDFRADSQRNLTLVLATSVTMTNAAVTLKNIERLDVIGGSGNDKFTGGKLADTLAGSDGADTIYGGDGDDTIGGNNIFGFYSYADYYFNGYTEQDGSRDKLYGESGNDKITIAAGDTADGGAGTDTLYVDFLAKTGSASFTFSTGKVKLDATTTADKCEVLYYLGGSGKDIVTGGNRSDTLDGNDGNDTLRGGDGNDKLIDGAGSDKLYGDAGNDTLTRSSASGTDVFDGGDGKDTLEFFSPLSDIGAVIIDLGNQSKNGGAAKGLTVKNIENITGSEHDDEIRGDSKVNVLSGKEGNDILAGGSGNDTLNGGGANDWLTGGAGNDRFVFSSDSRSHLVLAPKEGLIGHYWQYSSDDDDVITDFTRGEDKLVIDASAFGITDKKITLVTGADPQPKTAGVPTFLFDTDNGQLWFDPDGNKSASAPELIATLLNVKTLSTGDFGFL